MKKGYDHWQKELPIVNMVYSLGIACQECERNYFRGTESRDCGLLDFGGKQEDCRGYLDMVRKMNSKTLYKQVLLQYDSGSQQMSWIPSQFAKANKSLSIGKEERIEATVLEVFNDIELTELQLDRMSRTRFNSLNEHLIDCK